MGTSLTGVNISASYLGLLKSTDSSAIGSSAKTITDGAGNDLPIKLSTAQFLVSDGSSSTPTIGFSSDTDTGLYRTGSGVLGITSNGTLSGEVTLTGYRVRKNSTASAPVYSFIGETTTGLHSLDTGRLDFILGGNRAFGMTYGSGVGTLQTLSTDKMAFSVGGSERLRIINDGKIGIGTSTVTASAFMEIKGVGSLGTAIVKLMPSDATSTTALYNTSDGGDNAMSQYGTASGDTILQHIATSGELKLRVNGTTGLTMNQSRHIKLDAYGGGSITGTVTQRLGVTSSGQVVEIPIGAGALDGSGTAGKLAKFTDSDTLGDSIMSESGSTITMSGGADTILKVVGTTTASRLDLQTDSHHRFLQTIESDGRFRLYNQTTSSEQLTVLSDGKVGIGSSTISHQLQLHNPSGSGSQMNFTDNTTTSADGSGLRVGYNGTYGQMYLFENSYLRFGTNNAERMRLDSSGHLGVGTTSPDALIDIGVNNIITLDDTGSHTGFVGFGSYNDGSKNRAQGASYYGFGLEIDRPNQLISFNSYASTGVTTSGTDILVLKRTGDVGIGTDSPGAKLQIGSATYAPNSNLSNNLLQIKSASGFGYITIGNGDTANSTAYIGGASGLTVFGSVTDAGVITEHMRIFNDGDVGISTTSPSEKLHINGGLHVSSTANLTSGSTGLFMDYKSNESRLYSVAWGSAYKGMQIDALELKFNTGSGSVSERMHIDSSGITTLTAEGYQLAIKDQSSGNISEILTSNTAMGFFADRANAVASTSIIFSVDNTTALTIDDSQNATFENSLRTKDTIRIFKTGQTSQNTYSAVAGLQLHSQQSVSGSPYTKTSDIVANADGTVQSELRLFTKGNGDSTPSERLRITSDSNPTLRLGVSGTGTSIFEMKSASGGSSVIDAEQYLQIKTSGSERMRITSDGFVGVGTTSIPNPFSGAYSNILQVGTDSGNTRLAITAGSSNSCDLSFADSNNASSSDSYAGTISYKHATDSMIFTTATTERMRLDSSGRLGINESSPTTKLQITGSVGDDLIRLGIGQSADLFLGFDSTNPRILLQDNTNTNTHHFVSNGDNFIIGSNLGIGTSSPSTNLHISSATDTIVRITSADGSTAVLDLGDVSDPDGGRVFYDSGSNLGFTTQSIERLRVTSDGDVAINVTNPSAKLHVNSGTGNLVSLFQSTDAVGKIALFDNTTSNVYSVAIGVIGDDMTLHSGSGGSEAIRINSSGNVGIGTSSPDDPLHILGSANGNVNLRIENSNTGTNAYASLRFENNSIDTGVLFLNSSNNTQYGGANSLNLYQGGNHTIGFSTNNLLRMAIKGDGSVGIGTNSPNVAGFPSSTLTVEGSSTNYGAFELGSASQTSANGRMGEIRFYNKESANPYGFASIRGLRGASAGDSHITFFTSSSNTGSERVRITSSGSLCVNTTDDTPNGVSISASVVGYNDGSRFAGHFATATSATSTALVFSNTNGLVGSVTTSGTSTSYNTSSDYRLKEDLQDFNALDIASKIKMYDFKWKADDSRSYGVMAHELEEVLPQAVSGKKDAEEMQQVDYSKLVPILLKSIQELKAEIDELKKNK